MNEVRPGRAVCWVPMWNPERPGVGLEHLVLTGTSADAVVLGIDPDSGPFRLAYRLQWDERWRIRSAHLTLTVAGVARALHLGTDGDGSWHREDGERLDELHGCLDVDIWPTPFTNTFPLRRERLAVGVRRELTVAWIDGTALTVTARRQAYTRLAERLYRFEALDAGGFTVDLPVDEDGVVLDYPGLFRRVA